MDKRLLREYAKLIVKKGVNVAKDQIVVIKASVEVYDFVRMVVEEAYKAGAKKVIVDYQDVYNTRFDYLYQELKTLEEVAD